MLENCLLLFDVFGHQLSQYIRWHIAAPCEYLETDGLYVVAIYPRPSDETAPKQGNGYHDSWDGKGGTSFVFGLFFIFQIMIFIWQIWQFHIARD